MLRKPVIRIAFRGHNLSPDRMGQAFRKMPELTGRGSDMPTTLYHTDSTEEANEEIASPHVKLHLSAICG